LPDAAAPLVNAREPEVPDTAALDVATTIEPEELLVLAPARTETDPPYCEAAVAPPASMTTEPPVSPDDTPASKAISPPTPLLLLPTKAMMEPPLPPEATPEYSNTDPELPECVVPVLKVIEPETPAETAFEDSKVRNPVGPLVLAPPNMLTDPPDWLSAVVLPAERTNCPPTPLLPEPTTTLTAPPLPLDAEPVFSAK